MNLEIEVPGLKIKLEYAEKKHIDRTISAVMHYVQGGKFTDVYDVAQNYVEMENLKPSKRRVTQEVDGVKTYPDGKTKYKCSYNCSSCNHKGVRWILTLEDPVHCHNCNQKLKVDTSTPNDAHDEEFNYYLAY